jgi:hypothetical protein
MGTSGCRTWINYVADLDVELGDPDVEVPDVEERDLGM